MTKPLVYKNVFFGAGGHAKVVLDAAKKAGISIRAAYANHASHDSFEGLPLIIGKEVSLDGSMLMHIAIGDNQVRKRIALKYGLGVYFTVIHPTAVIAPDVKIAEGCFIGPRAIINAGATIEAHTIINSGAIVEHDVCVGAYAHICPGAIVAGGVNIGEGVMIGVGAAVIPQIHIGDWAVVGAGAAVVRDISANARQGGVPARDLAY